VAQAAIWSGPADDGGVGTPQGATKPGRRGVLAPEIGRNFPALGAGSPSVSVRMRAKVFRCADALDLTD